MTGTKNPMSRAERILLPLLTALALLGVWALAVRLTGTKIFPSPGDVARGLNELMHRGLLAGYVRDSLMRVSIGYGIAVIAGIPLGLLIGWFAGFGRIVNPIIQMLRPISPIAWMPLAVIWFGVGEPAPIFLIVLGALFPLVVATANGVRNVPLIYLRAGTNFGLTNASVLRRVVFPAILPSILTGLRISLGIAWLVLVAAEMIAVDSGLGYLIIDARNAGKRYDLVVAGMILIGLIGLGLDTAIRRLEKVRSLRWGFVSQD